MFSRILPLILGVVGVVISITQPTVPPYNTTSHKTAPPQISLKNSISQKNTGKETLAPQATSTSKIIVKKEPPKESVIIASKPKPAEQKAKITIKLPEEAPIVSETVISSPPPDFQLINKTARKAIVNIICTLKSGGSFEPLSGSGVIIDPRGFILTNAHIGQYLLLKDYRGTDFLNCIARTGSPAIPAYTLKILYISPQWVTSNYQKVTNDHPTGTGENDFAILQIASSTNPDRNLPSLFDYIPYNENQDDIKTGNTVVLVSYPAGFLGGIEIQTNLNLVSSVVNIGKLFTFKSETLDVFSLGGSPVAQHGSSGGAVVSGEGKLLGIIVTSTDATETSNRDLDAISIAHINRSLYKDVQLDLQSLLASNIEKFSTEFNNKVVPTIKNLLVTEINSKNR